MVPSTVEEAWPPGQPVGVAAVAVALAKARDVARRVAGPAAVLGADTVVVLDGRPFGKPASPADARSMLTALAGRAHEVVTGLAVVETGTGRALTAAVTSRVVMRAYGGPDVDAYLATDEPWDKAGAYAVQGAGGRLVERVAGCYTNVVGLPVATTARLLREFGLTAASASDRAPCGPP